MKPNNDDPYHLLEATLIRSHGIEFARAFMDEFFPLALPSDKTTEHAQSVLREERLGNTSNLQPNNQHAFIHAPVTDTRDLSCLSGSWPAQTVC